MRAIPGVGDAGSVTRVATWHEIMHVERDLPLLRRGTQAAFGNPS